MDNITAAQVLSGLSLLCAGVVITLLRGLNTKSAQHDEAFARIEALLTGANGDNGLNGDVRQLKEWQREMERRHGPDDRRTA